MSKNNLELEGLWGDTFLTESDMDLCCCMASITVEMIAEFRSGLRGMFSGVRGLIVFTRSSERGQLFPKIS